MVFVPDRDLEPNIEVNFDAKYLALGIFSGVTSLMLATIAYFSINLAYDPGLI